MKPHGLAKPSESETLFDYLVPPKTLRETIKGQIDNISVTLSSPLRDSFDYHFSCLGKLLRADLAFHSAQARGLSLSSSNRWALCIELIHNASLIHDDICDSDLTRRGQPTVREKFGEETAIVLGDTVLAQSFSVLAADPQLVRLIPILADTVAQLSAGQALEFSPDFKFDWASYERLVGLKTAPLMKLPVQGLLHTEGAFSVKVEGIEKYLELAALAYQIKNDIDDVEEGIKGSFVGRDFSDGRPNAVTVMYLCSQDRSDRTVVETADLIPRQLHGCGTVTADRRQAQWQELLNSSAVRDTIDKLAVVVLEAEEVASRLSSEDKALIAPINKCLKPCSAKSILDQPVIRPAFNVNR